MEQEKEKKAVDVFMDGIQKDTPETFEEPEKPATEEKQEEDEKPVVEEKPIPFHKDPKIMKFIGKEVDRRLAERPQVFKEDKVEKDNEIVQVLTRIIGNDTPDKVTAVRELYGIITKQSDLGAEKAFERFQKEQELDREADEAAEQELDEGFDSVEEAFHVDLSSNKPLAKKMRNEFIDYIERIAPKDENGEVVAFPDFVAAFETFQELNKARVPSASRAKELANRSLSRSSETQETVPTDNSWKTVEKVFSKLG